MRTGGENIRRISDFGFHPSWSPDGTRLAGSFSGEPMKAGFYSFTKNRFDRVGKMEKLPVWLPDTRRLIWVLKTAFSSPMPTPKKLVNST
jgi:hypothetical protein